MTSNEPEFPFPPSAPHAPRPPVRATERPTSAQILRLVAHELKTIEKELRSFGATLSQGNATDQFVARSLAAYGDRISALTRVCRAEADGKAGRSTRDMRRVGNAPGIKLFDRNGRWYAHGTYRDGSKRIHVRKSLGIAVADVSRAKALRVLKDFIAQELCKESAGST